MKALRHDGERWGDREEGERESERENLIVCIHSEIVERKSKIITFSCKRKKIATFDAREIERELKHVWRKITYINRVRKYGTIEVMFQDEDTAKLYSWK